MLNRNLEPQFVAIFPDIRNELTWTLPLPPRELKRLCLTPDTCPPGRDRDLSRIRPVYILKRADPERKLEPIEVEITVPEVKTELLYQQCASSSAAGERRSNDTG